MWIKCTVTSKPFGRFFPQTGEVSLNAGAHRHPAGSWRVTPAHLFHLPSGRPSPPVLPLWPAAIMASCTLGSAFSSRGPQALLRCPHPVPGLETLPRQEDRTVVESWSCRVTVPCAWYPGSWKSSLHALTGFWLFQAGEPIPFPLPPWQLEQARNMVLLF